MLPCTHARVCWHTCKHVIARGLHTDGWPITPQQNSLEAIFCNCSGQLTKGHQSKKGLPSQLFGSLRAFSTAPDSNPKRQSAKFRAYSEIARVRKVVATHLGEDVDEIGRAQLVKVGD